MKDLSLVFFKKSMPTDYRQVVPDCRSQRLTSWDRPSGSRYPDSIVLDDILALSFRRLSMPLYAKGATSPQEFFKAARRSFAFQQVSCQRPYFRSCGACWRRNYTVENLCQLSNGQIQEIVTSINKIIKWIGPSLIPISIALFCKQLLISDQEVSRAIVSTVAALVGMIPEGLVLLTSVVLAISVIRLSQHKNSSPRALLY